MSERAQPQRPPQAPGAARAGREPLIALRGVDKIYGEGPTAVHAMRAVDLEVEAGDFVAIMGPSGSGKSTCMNILGCLDTPTAGHHRFLGIEVERLHLDQLALLRRHAIGFVFQGFQLLGRTSALENVELPLIYQRVPGRERRARALEALREVGLAGREHHTPAELSGGQQQRVAIARALVTRPSLLLADEPTGNLDSKMKFEILGLLSRLNEERGLTVVMVTHEPDLGNHAARAIVFRDGRIESDERLRPLEARAS